MTAAGGEPRQSSPQEIDLNADVGEDSGRWSLGTSDSKLIPSLTSANVACGAHAGDPTTMRRSCHVAAHHDVRVGAHVGYPDLLGFGRRAMDLEPGRLTDLVIAQIGALQACAVVEGSEVVYVKPHGALYHACSQNAAVAAAVVDAVWDLSPQLVILCAPRSQISEVAGLRGLRAVHEAFADRGYDQDGQLVPRGQPGSVLDERRAVAQGVAIASRGFVETRDGQNLAVRARSICVHGDTPGAPVVAASLREALAASGVDVVAFA